MDEKELLPEEVTQENTAEPTEETVETAEETADEIAEYTAEESAEETAESEEQQLQDELEEIRDMFQKELDSAAEMAEQGELIQDLEEITEEPVEELTEEEKCRCCEENPRATEYGEDYPYCENCRSFMKRYPLRKSGVLMFLLMIAVFVATVVTSISAVDTNMYLLQGYANHTEGKPMSAIEGYYYYLSSADSENVSMSAVRNLIEDYAKTGYMSDAVKLIQQYYSETDLKMPWNSKYRKIVEKTEVDTATYYAVSDIVSPAFSGEDFDYDKVLGELNALREEKDADGNRKYSDLFIDYFAYELMRINGASVEERLAALLEIDEKHKGDEWVYLATLCSVAALSGDEELTEDTFNRCIRLNKQDSNAYIAYASYYRFLDTPDPDKIIEICNLAAENAYTNDKSYKQYLTIAYLLKGEGAVALETMEDFMSSGSYNVSMCNLYALTGLYNGNKDIYKEMKEMLEQYGYEISPLVTKYKNGKMTIEEVLADKGGDIA